ncbi:putative peroxidase [Tanacetum coccineum]|uniref:Peroxidase n=1 Tax=Tanacetum coccineum TaxID=301880 RepID=A0ABQ4Y1C7_9ASTR
MAKSWTCCSSGVCWKRGLTELSKLESSMEVLCSARFVVVMGLIATNVMQQNFMVRKKKNDTLHRDMAESAETPTAYMTPFSVADSSKRKSKKMHDAMTDPSDGNSESAEDTSGQVDGPSWAVRLGRRVSIDSNATQAVEDLPRGSDNPTQLIASFDK